MQDLIEEEKEKCLAFANSNPETVLPANLDVDESEVLKTHVRSSFSNPVGTAHVLERTHAALTKVRPCGLSHLFRIS